MREGEGRSEQTRFRHESRVPPSGAPIGYFSQPAANKPVVDEPVVDKPVVDKPMCKFR